MTLTIHHYYPLGSTNTGDALVARAIGQHLRQHLGDGIDIVPMPVNDRLTTGAPIGLRGANLERTNAEADVVVVGGSNLLEPRHDGGWGVFTDVDSIARLRPPLLLIGMGTGSDFARPVRDYVEPALSQVRALHARADVALVRDQLTADTLSRLGIDATCVGCPVMFMTDRPVTAAAAAGDGPVLVSMPPSRLMRTWRGRRFMRAAMTYVDWLRRRDDVEVIVTLHDTRDREPAAELVPRGVATFDANDLDALIARFDDCRAVIGFRLHAALLGLALGKPVLPVALDWRGRAFVATAGLGDLSVDAQQPALPARLRDLTARLLADASAAPTRMTDAKQRLAGRYHAALADAAARLEPLRTR
ncbi:MAG: hypothetical protein GC159_02785 [Phycisphaera sp.]|nr:hypothetical protein [Phycisphaera sp.]